jgi:NADH pyrophosphatase NudC (nudix superfamily)
LGKIYKWNINLNKNELSEYIWVKENEIIKYLEKWGFPEYEIKRFLEDFKNFKENNNYTVFLTQKTKQP